MLIAGVVNGNKVVCPRCLTPVVGEDYGVREDGYYFNGRCKQCRVKVSWGADSDFKFKGGSGDEINRGIS